MLEDRPAVHNGIKKLRVEWFCEEHAHELDSIVVEFCEYLSEHLVLDEFLLVFSSTLDILKQLVDDGDHIAWVQAFRKINVQKLTVKLWISDQDFDEEMDDDASDEGSEDDSSQRC